MMACSSHSGCHAQPVDQPVAAASDAPDAARLTAAVAATAAAFAAASASASERVPPSAATGNSTTDMFGWASEE
eukprot:337430-Chlamydomonas_euryale.AAC.1